MHKNALKLIKRNCYVLLLILIVLAVVLLNYEPGTWLSGWDNLHPEFNFGLNIKRSLFAVWQEYQGLGLLGGMGHAADLPRQVFLYIFSFFLPANFLRYFYHFLMLLLGILGIRQILYEFVLLGRSKRDRKKGAFLGSLFYLLNLGTVQYFFLPFEPFSTFYGMFPWLIYVLLRYLENPTKKNLAVLAGVNFLASPIGYVQTVFFVYLFVVGIFLVWQTLLTLGTKRALAILAVIFSVNAYWLMPNLYWLATNRQVTQEANINRITTDEIFIRAQKFGTIADFSLLRNKPWDYLDWSVGTSRGLYLMRAWRKYYTNPSVLFFGYLLFGIVLLGLLQKSKYRKELLSLFALSLVVFLSRTPIFVQLNNIFRSLPLLHQALRDPFTKFIVPAEFVFAVGLSLGGLRILEYLSKRKSTVVQTFAFTAIVGIIVALAFPVFRGGLFSDRVHAEIPSEYFELIDFFNKQDAGGRIVNLPQDPIWGWTTYSWGYTGSGFLWYRIEQPITDRAFDVWSRQLENFYWELRLALNRGDISGFDRVLDKYDIRFVVFDKNVVYPDNPNDHKLVNSELALLKESGILREVGRFGEISVYKVNLRQRNGKLYLAQDLPEVNSYKWGDYDRAYKEYGNYISSGNGIKRDSKLIQDNNIIYYPFRSLFSGRGSQDNEFRVEKSGEDFVFKTQVPKELAGGTLIFPALDKEEISVRDKNNVLKASYKLPEVYLDGEYIPLSDRRVKLPYIGKGVFETRVPAEGGFYSYDSAEDSSLKKKINIFNIRTLSEKINMDIYLPDLRTNKGYLIGVQSRNIKGRPIKFWLENLTAKRDNLQVFLGKQKNMDLEYFVVPPMQEDGSGYTLHFDNEPIGRQERVNKLGRIVIQPVPYKFLNGIKIVKNLKPQPKNQNLTSVDPPNPSLYIVEINQNNKASKDQVSDILSNQGNIVQGDSGEGFNNGTMEQLDNRILVLSQAYDPGWRAYLISNSQFSILNSIKKSLPFLFGKKLNDHVLVNNWANGWQLEAQSSKLKAQNQNAKPKTVILIYLPQYLQYLGFVLLLVVPLTLGRYKDA